MSRSIQHPHGAQPGEPAAPVAAASRDGAGTSGAGLRGLVRPLSFPQLVLDIGLAAAFALILGPLSLLMLATGSSLALALVVTALMTVALAIARLSPALALLLAWIGALVQMGFGAPPLPINLAILGVLYATAAYGSRLLVRLGFVSALVGAGAVAVYLAVTAVPPGVAFSWDAFFVGASIYLAFAIAFVLAWTVGLLVRSAQRARRIRLAQAAAERAVFVEQERGRIARDMHDVVAHSLAVVIAQADGARYAAQHDPRAGTAALETIAGTARAALADVRMLLTQLRYSEAAGPQPTLADLDQLYAQVRAAGAAVYVEVAPTPPGLPPAAVQIAVYRILQEALTNALRHGTGAEVWVRLGWHADRVELEVRNPARPDAATPHAGHGLVGMGERAALVGGSLRAAPQGGQFVVSATLPIGAPA